MACANFGEYQSYRQPFKNIEPLRKKINFTAKHTPLSGVKPDLTPLN
jgi:hypothetical protein